MRKVSRVLTTVALLCITSACSVRIVSPYNQDVAKEAKSLHDDIIRFSYEMQRKAGTADATLAKNQATYEGWLARLATMRSISEMQSPGVVGCQQLLFSSERAGLPPNPLADAALRSQASTGDAGLRSLDCQSYAIALTAQQVRDVMSVHDAVCKGTPATATQCRSLFGPPLPENAAVSDRIAALLNISGGTASSALISSVQALMRIQEVKKPSEKQAS